MNDVASVVDVGPAVDDAPTVDAGPAAPLAHPPPPISGGALGVAPDGVTAVVSDPDLDRVVLVDLSRRAVTATLALAAGDEPGRVAFDGHGRAHVALRRGGALLTVDLAARAVVARRSVCAAPRGVAWRAAGDVVYVACAGGELVTLPAAGGDETARVTLDRDLRDVVPAGDDLLVTRFRDATVLVVRGGRVVERIAPAASSVSESVSVAWRATPAPGGGLWLLHERAGESPLQVTGPGYYASTVQCQGADGVVRPGLVRVNPPFGQTVLPDVRFAPLAVDVAAHPTLARLALAVPGAFGSPTAAQVVEVDATALRGCVEAHPSATPRGQVVAVAYTPSGQLVAQTRAPSTLVFPGGDGAVELGGADASSEGHRLFHTNTTGTVACAACHAEGGDDGRVWNFALQGARRTPSLAGGILATAPFHWRGDLADVDALVREVMVRGMRAPMPDAAGVAALGAWLDAIPARPAAAVDAAAARGEALFRDPVTACATCHSGPMLTDNATVDVGTGGAFQVPSLRGLRWRAPYMHDGCAATLRDRFGRCGGGDAHGRTSQLTPAQLDDLVAYMETL